MNSPILMSSGLLTLAANQQQEVSDPTRFQNPFRTPMFIDEIRFVMVGGWSQNFLQAKFRLGRTPLSRDYTPIGNFGRSLRASARILTWRLPKPLYVPANEYLVPHVRNTYTSSQQIEVIYAGRSLAANAPVPKSIFVPWVAAYQPAGVTTPAGNGNTIVASSEADIVNPFDVSMYVQRFLGRYQTNVSLVANQGEATGEFLDNTYIRAVNHEGTILVKDSTPFGALFDYTTKAWPAGTVLPPKGFFLFEVERDFGSIASATQTTAPIISMVGYREVEVR